MERKTILDLPPDEFQAALAELSGSMSPDQVDFLTREYQNRQSPMSGLYGFLDRTQDALSGKGMERASILPFARPEGVSLAQSLQDGTWEFAVPGAILDAFRGTARAVDAPAAALKGVPYTQQQIAENAMSGAGLAMAGGAAFPSPKGAIRSNTPSWFGKFTSSMTDEEFSEYSTMPQEVKQASVSLALDGVEGKAGDAASIWQSLAEANKKPAGDAPEQIPAPPSMITIDQPEPSWNGKHIIDMDAKEWEAFKAAGQPSSNPNSGIADWKGKKQHEWAAEKNAAKTSREDAEYDRLTQLLSGKPDVPAPRNSAEQRSLEIAQMLKEGRAAEITDDLYDTADLPYLNTLYRAGMTGRNMPMDFKSRMERAASQGFNTGNPLYRGRGGDRSRVSEGQTTFTSDNPAVAAGYVKYDGNMVKLLGRGGAEMPEVVPPVGTSWSQITEDSIVRLPDGEEMTVGEFTGNKGDYFFTTDRIGAAAANRGYPGARFTGIVDEMSDAMNPLYRDMGLRHDNPSNVRVDAPDTTNLRLPTAVFDPRLRHLRNYSAANASPIMSLPTVGQEQTERGAESDVLRYLQRIQDRR